MTPQISLAHLAPPECEQDHRALLLGNGERTRTASTSRRGRKNDPLYRARRTLHTGADLLTDKQTARLTALFAIDEHVEVEATWGIYQRMITAYRHPRPSPWPRADGQADRVVQRRRPQAAGAVTGGLHSHLIIAPQIPIPRPQGAGQTRWARAG